MKKKCAREFFFGEKKIVANLSKFLMFVLLHFHKSSFIVNNDLKHDEQKNVDFLDINPKTW